MKCLRTSLSVLVLTLLSTLSFAQTDAMSTMKPSVQSDAQKSFDEMKTLEGAWDGHVTTVPARPEIEGKAVHATLRVTSMGHAMIHEMRGADRPDDPITMIYVDGDRLLLTHYCDAGNRPRMTGKASPDGKNVEFAFLDLSGGTQYGHMDHAVFTVIDENHHVEDWTYMEPGDKPVHAHIDLQRSK